MKMYTMGYRHVSGEFWWGVAAGIVSLCAVFIVPAFVGAEGEDGPVTAPTSSEYVLVSVRTETGVVAQERVVMPSTDATSTFITPSLGGDPIAIDARSALAMLTALDTSSSAFTITDLAYYEAYGSFFLNCMDVPEHLCGYWQYTVNGTYPSLGADKYVLQADDQVYFFFGSPRLVTLSATSTFVDESFTATLTQYAPDAGEYVPTGGFTLGVVQDDPENPFVPKEILTQVTDNEGRATFTVATSGVYAVGIQEDFYYPSVPFIVRATTSSSTVATSTASTTDTSRAPQSGGGSILNNNQATSFDVAAALSFLATHQKSDGTFGAPIFTDWSAIALSSGSTENSARDRVAAYLTGNTSGLTHATDYERRAMALMALSINPYTGTPVDVIAHIVGMYDGVQVGDSALVNDDIFALIPLERAGFSTDEDMMQRIVAFVVSKQQANGAWEGSVDLTAAAVQALVPFHQTNGVDDALTRAKTYLKSAQKADGGFGDSFSTSWVIQAIHALGDAMTDWKKNGTDPLGYLVTRQYTDGGLESPDTDVTSRIWATAYAVPAALGKSWASIMRSFTVPASFSTTAVSGGGSRDGLVVATTTNSTATSTASSSATLFVEVVEPGIGTTDESEATPDQIIALFAYAKSIQSPQVPADSVVAVTHSKVVRAPVAAADPRDGSTADATTTITTSSKLEQTAAVAQATRTVRDISRVLVGIFSILLIGFGVVLVVRTRQKSAR